MKETKGMRPLIYCFLLLPFLFSIGISLTIMSAGPVYRLYTSLIDLHSQVGLTQSNLQEELGGILKYLLDPRVEQLQLKYFPASLGGIQHFKDVKNLVQWNLYVSIIGIFVVGFILNKLKRIRAFRIDKGIKLLIMFPILLLVMIIFSFDQVFYLFHQILFSNDLWLFSPVTDPIILILPSELFALYFFIAIVLYEGLVLVCKRIIS